MKIYRKQKIKIKPESSQISINTSLDRKLVKLGNKKVCLLC